MSLHELPESSHTPRRSILPQRLVMTMAALALAACDRTETVESSPERAPTGAIVETLTDTTLATRHALARKVYEETLGTTGGDFYQRGFPHDPEHPTDWHIHQLDVGFGPQRGIHIVTWRRVGDKTYVNDMLDAEGDGDVDYVESSTSFPVKTNTGTSLMRSEKSYVLGNRIFDHFASAMQQARRVLAKEKEAQKGK